jgi:phosphonate transport system substrate-binding protein
MSFMPRLRCCPPLLCCCLLFLLLLAGCDDNRSSAPSSTPAPPPQPAAGSKFTIGLMPEQDIFVQRRRYAPIAEYLSGEIGVEVELKIMRRYGNIVDQFTRQQLDGVFFGSFTGALAIAALGVEPLARPEYPGGISTYYGMIFVRRDSGIKSAADMKGKIFVFVDQATTAGWLLPLHYFHEHGVSDREDWFVDHYFSGTHEDAIRDVLEGRADIGAAKDLIFERLAAVEPRIREELEILAVSPPVPSNTLAVRGDLDPALKARLREVLLAMEHTPAGRQALADFGADRFLATEVADYQPVFDYARAVGIDLTTYEYRNR